MTAPRVSPHRPPLPRGRNGFRAAHIFSPSCPAWTGRRERRHDAPPEQHIPPHRRRDRTRRRSLDGAETDSGGLHDSAPLLRVRPATASACSKWRITSRSGPGRSAGFIFPVGRLISGLLVMEELRHLLSRPSGERHTPPPLRSGNKAAAAASPHLSALQPPAAGPPRIPGRPHWWPQPMAPSGFPL